MSFAFHCCILPHVHVHWPASNRLGIIALEQAPFLLMRSPFLSDFSERQQYFELVAHLMNVWPLSCVDDEHAADQISEAFAVQLIVRWKLPAAVQDRETSKN